MKSREERLALNCSLAICEVGSGGGLLLPAGGDGEQEWPNGLRIVLYLIGLLWLFMGVAIVADVFMGAIEKITSKKTRVWRADLNKFFTVAVWNPTVANLTLMALGSSAPEILLSLIELFGAGFYSGSLGPSTIVGSAAFNLLVISAVCVCAIPGGESRTIKEFGVFGVTAFFSIFAYIWLLLIVQVITPDVIDIWEGVITFLLFPALVVIAWMADVGYFSTKKADDEGEQGFKRLSIMDMSKDDLAKMSKRASCTGKSGSGIGKQGVALTEDQVAKIIQSEMAAPKSRAAYRVGATRKMVGGKRVAPVPTPQQIRASQVVPDEASESESEKKEVKIPVTFAFTAAGYAVMENIGFVNVPVKMNCTGKFTKPVSVDYSTRNGTAKEGTDYEPASGTLVFHPGEQEKQVVLKIKDDDTYEADEYLFLDLSKPVCSEEGFKAEVGENMTCKIAIIDDDHPGVFSFDQESVQVTEGDDVIQVPIQINRADGANGEVSCIYHTENDSAIAGKDFEGIESTALHFAHGQTEAKIEVSVYAIGRYEVSEQFRLVLTQPKGGARFDPKTDGGHESNICTVIINPNEQTQKKTDLLMNKLVYNWDKSQLGHANWRDQFKDAICPGGDGEDEDEKPGPLDWVMHIITVFWKVLFACIPPTDFCDGWLCFVCSLVMIGAVTAVIGDLAGLLGCTMGLPDAITAITFVALGTSLPDTFASKAAAEQDPYADASIGNVTGSNSVNVFLGLGLPWLIGSIYWAAAGFEAKWGNLYPEVKEKFPDGGKFVVIGGDLGFSVTVFCICAVACVGLIILRRYAIKPPAELGGPTAIKYATGLCFVCLWFLYVALSSWKVMDTRSKDICFN